MITSTISGSYHRYEWGPCTWLVFLSNKRSGPSGAEYNRRDPEYGYVYAERDDTNVEVGLHYIQHGYRSAPAVSGTTGNYMARPFGYDGGGISGSDDNIDIVIPTGGSVTTSVFIYQPHSWYGRVGQVIAAILLDKGLDDDYIDQTAFSDADDGQAAMGSNDDDEPFVFYRRQLGQTVGEAVKALAMHSWDILTVNMAGKVALHRRVSPAAGFVISSLGTSDGVVSVKWRKAYDRLVNHMWACEGRYYEYSLETVGDFSGRISSMTEIAFPTSTLETNDMPFEEFSDSTSITKYGDRGGPAREIRLQDGREVKTIRHLHYPYLCNIQGSSGDPMDAKATLLARLASVEAVLRKEITVVQDFRGLDYDVGWKVASVAVTKDSATVDDTRCVRKTIDFNDYSVTSVLLEEPS